MLIAVPETNLPTRSQGSAKIEAIGRHTEIQRRAGKKLSGALQSTNWKINGSDGALELLGTNPMTSIAHQ